MITLDATTKSLEIDLTGAVATNQLPFVACYVDISQSTFAMSAVAEQDGTSNSTTAVTCLSAPGASTSRVLKFFSWKNSDTAAREGWLQLNNNGTLREIWKGTLQVGDTLFLVDAANYHVLDSSGNIKTSLAAATNWAVTVLTVATKMSAAYIWTAWNPSDVIGTYTNAANSAASSYADGTYFTQSNSSGTVTLTFVKAGSYVVNLTVGIQNAAIYTYEDFKATTGGTATAYRTNNIQLGAGDSVNDLDFKTTETIGIVATAGQTLTILPAFRVVGAGTTAQYLGSAGYTVMYCGG